MNDSWANVPALVNDMPAPVELRRELIDRITAAYYDLVKERGEVHTPEDTFAMQRRLGGTRDQFSGYMDAFKAGAALLKELQEEELVLAVGEQDGVPNQGLTIPDAEGDIRISLDTPKSYTIELDQLVAVLIANILDSAPVAGDVDLIPYAVTETVKALQEWGKVEPQVSKVRAWAATLARAGRDRDASVVKGAIHESTPYKGVKFTRKDPT